MIPISDENPTLRRPVVTLTLLGSLAAVWLVVQGGGFDTNTLAASVCNLGMVAGELTGQAPLGQAVPMGPNLACVVDREPINFLTPITSMFLHGGWGHLLGNALFLWVFGNNVEDTMGRVRFVFFYLLCGLAAAAAQIAVDPAAAVPMVGASGAISGVLGGYLVLYPRVRVNILFIFIFIIRIIPLPAYWVLLWWIGYQVVLGGSQVAAGGANTGVAFWAHIGGFATGLLLIKLFTRKDLLQAHHELLRRHGLVR